MIMQGNEVYFYKQQGD